MYTKVSERGQVTIPKGVRDRLGILPGTELEFGAEDGRLVARKVAAANPFGALYGTVAGSQRTDDIIGRLRGKPDAV